MNYDNTYKLPKIQKNKVEYKKNSLRGDATAPSEGDNSNPIMLPREFICGRDTTLETID